MKPGLSAERRLARGGPPLKFSVENRQEIHRARRKACVKCSIDAFSAAGIGRP
jgi:hypothetical protein